MDMALNIIEAAKSGRPFKRKNHHTAWRSFCDSARSLCFEEPDLSADDWEVAPKEFWISIPAMAQLLKEACYATPKLGAYANACIQCGDKPTMTPIDNGSWIKVREVIE